MPEANQVTVLTVDDNETLRYSITRMLLDAGFKVIEAKTGREALEKAASLPDLITLDVNLPDIDGFQVCRQLKSDPQTRHIPVLHISGTFVDPEYRVQGLQGGADAYLAEPIDRAEFVATVEALLRIKRSEKQAIRQAIAADTERNEARLENAQLEARVRERTLELENKSQEIRRLNLHLMKIQDDERRRIARELHDSTGQLLTLLTLNLSRLSRAEDLPPGAAEVVAENVKITAELTSQLRTVSYLLHPPLLDELGLPSAVHWLVQGFAERSHISVDVDIAKDFCRLDEDLELAIFRIIQECLTNVHRHSGSPSAVVSLRRDEREIVVEVRDQGGTTATGAPVRPGTGILGMRERAHQFNGELTTSYGPGGACVSTRIPLAAPDKTSAQSTGA